MSATDAKAAAGIKSSKYQNIPISCLEHMHLLLTLSVDSDSTSCDCVQTSLVLAVYPAYAHSTHTYIASYQRVGYQQ
jgi:hypothetical protein